MRIVFMGTPDFAVSILKGLIDSGYLIGGVYTKRDKPQGRGQAVSISAVKSEALAHNLRVFQPPSLRSQEEVEKLRELDPDAIVVAAYGLILPPRILAIPKYGCLNVHPSLLPKYRGPSPVSTAILNGDATTGVSIMLMDEGTDTGPVLAQAEEAILPDDTTASLEARLSQLGSRLLLDTIPKWVSGTINAVPQDPSAANYSRVLRKEDGDINWEESAAAIERRVRALLPWPGAYSCWKGKRLKITKAAVAPGARGQAAGKIVGTTSDGRVIPAAATGDGLLVLETVQLEGKREMPGEEFVRGQRDFIGSALARCYPGPASSHNLPA